MTSKVLLSATFATFFLVGSFASACPDCALQSSGGIIEPQTMGSKMAFSSSTLLLLGIFFSVVGFMVWIMIRTCQELSRERTLSSPRGI